MQVRIYIRNHILYFILTNEKVKENLNNTNVINLYSFQFTKSYIYKHIDLVTAFLSLLLVKNKIKEVVIGNDELYALACQLLSSFDIEKIHFQEDTMLTYNVVRELLKIQSLQCIDCYSMSSNLIKRFPKNVVETRSEILCISHFMTINSLDSYSKMCTIENITVQCDKMLQEDFDDIQYLLDINKHIKIINLINYRKKNFYSLIELINQAGLPKIDIFIYASEEAMTDISNDIKNLKELDNKTNIHVKIKYTKDYKDKFKWKEINLRTLRFIAVFLIMLSLCILAFSKYLDNKEKEILEQNLEHIQEAVESSIVEVTNPQFFDDTESDVTLDKEEKKTYQPSIYDQKLDPIYENLLNINQDTVGWLKVNNTKIDYPVVQTSDNDYYLNHAFDHTKNQSGWVFADYRNNMDELDQNTILYAHNSSRNQIMFGSLKKVLDSNWYSNDANLTINFSVKGVQKEWKIFAIYTIDVTDDYLITNFNSDESFNNYINSAKQKSIVNFNESVTENDKILTLSTCYKDSDHRLVVHAKLV